jgi:hypothetical protein
MQKSNIKMQNDKSKVKNGLKGRAYRFSLNAIGSASERENFAFLSAILTFDF